MEMPLADATDDGRRERRLAAGLAALFGLVAILCALDLAADVGEGAPAWHVAIEAAAAAGGLASVVAVGLRYRRLRAAHRVLRAEADALSLRLDASRAEAERWRAEARDLISGLGAAIDQQLDRWQLSPAEKEVALLLLKGLSHKEIAELRRTGEATVRQQAGALYRKAGLSGRRDLAAFFLEDLLGPRT